MESRRHARRAGTIIAVRTERDYIILQLRHNVSPFYWGFPKGGVEPGESEEQAALRETFEESGIKLSIEQLKPSMCVRFQYHTYYIVVMDKYPEVKVDGREISAYRWISLTDIEMLNPMETSKPTAAVWQKVRNGLLSMVVIVPWSKNKNGFQCLVNKSGSPITEKCDPDYDNLFELFEYNSRAQHKKIIKCRYATYLILQMQELPNTTDYSIVNFGDIRCCYSTKRVLSRIASDSQIIDSF